MTESANIDERPGLSKRRQTGSASQGGRGPATAVATGRGMHATQNVYGSAVRTRTRTGRSEQGHYPVQNLPTSRSAKC